jgi:putative transposase
MVPLRHGERLVRGKRPELTGGGLLRSYGSWKEVKSTPHFERKKGDERILGDSSFVQAILTEAQERRRSAASKMSLDALAERVGALTGIDPHRLSDKSRRAHVVEARGLYCYFACRELGYAATNVASYLGLTQPGVGYAADRGEIIAREKAYTLGEER